MLFSWSVSLEGGPRRVNHAAAAIDGYVYSFGGYCTGENYRNRRLHMDVNVLNTSTYRWRRIEPPTPEVVETEEEEMAEESEDDQFEDADDENPSQSVWPSRRYGHAVAAVGHLVYMFGGRNDQHVCNYVWVFDTRDRRFQRLETKGQGPFGRDGHTMTYVNGALWLFGGFEEASSSFSSSDVYKLDLETLTWSCHPCSGAKPDLRDFHAAVRIRDRIYVFGGRSEEPVHLSEYYPDEISYLDTKTMIWHRPVITSNINSSGHRVQPDQPPVGPVGRRSLSACEYNGNILLFGGFNGITDEHLDDLWLYNVEHSYWTELKMPKTGVQPCARRRHAMVRVGSKIFLFGGTSPYKGPPIKFTEQQLENIPHENTFRLMDRDDLFVLHCDTSLRTLALLSVIKHQLPVQELPKDLRTEIDMMTKRNSISEPLPIRRDG